MKLKPDVVDESFSVEKFRKETEKATSRMKLPKGVASKKFKINENNAEWITPANAIDRKVLLYIHGGGFISGSCNTHRIHLAKFAKGCQLKSLVFDYRLDPEHPFPAAVDDCLEAYQWLLTQNYNAEDIVVGGESAGGTLTLSLLLALKEKGMKLPKAAFSISPVTDLRCATPSFTYNAKKDIAPYGSWNVWTRLYVAGNEPTNPLLSPQFGNYASMPPLLICVGTHEIHLDDCIALANTAKEHGADITLSKWPNMVHAFPIMSPLFPEAKQAMQEICRFARKNIAT